MEQLTASENAELAATGSCAKTRTDEWHEAGRLWRAIMLSTSLEMCEALLRGERVPFNRLDPLWARRFGLKQEAA